MSFEQQLDLFAVEKPAPVPTLSLGGKQVPVRFQWQDHQWHGRGRIPAWFLDNPDVTDLQTGRPVAIVSTLENTQYGWWNQRDGGES